MSASNALIPRIRYGRRILFAGLGSLAITGILLWAYWIFQRENERKYKLTRLRLENSAKVLKVRETLDREFAESGPIRFRAHDGEVVGAHEDKDIELRPDGSVVFVYYNYDAFEYAGQFSLDENSLLSFSKMQKAPPSQFEKSLPKMVLYVDESGLLLFPADGEFRSGNGNVGSKDGYWPFRRIPIASSGWTPHDFPWKKSENATGVELKP